MSKTFRILSIDGGGIRGVFPAHILCRISERLGIHVADRDDLIAGTSTGSILAAALACGISPERILDLYTTRCREIFIRRKTWHLEKWQQGFTSAYESNGLSRVLEDVFKNTKLKEVNRPLIIPSTDLGNGGVHVFKSSYSKQFVRDPEILVRSAVLASCSAPTFFDPAKVDPYLLADGGLWANNPSLVAYVDAQRRLGVAPADIKILSLGTGHSKIGYGTDTNRNWGLLNGWEGKRFIGFLLSLQAQSTNNTLKLLLQDKQLLRLDFESDNELPLDDINCIGDLQSQADHKFTHNAHLIQEFFQN